ncbi:hypothetical protein [Vibrio salinus]|uniref:hypothetical protein n=1 Tax=Vibrio salinus TaxID=2899784 RepID=UPI001E46F79B|nr:hypothetical protein [Vibrio salinus]MCE0495087.1 hypothetical protein [Vibrio salinus]
MRDIGSFIVEVTGTVYGAIAASMTLSDKLQVGNTPTGQFGVRGVMPTTTEFTTEGKISGEVFAGLKVGGTVDCKLNWKPTEADAKALSITREFKNLFKVGGGMEAKAGFGGKCEFTLTYNKGRFQVILNAGLTSGLGCEGKIAAEINPDNIDDLFTVLINLMTHRDFKRFAFFDESNDKDETFRKFNDMITVAVAFGLTFGELALLPFTVIDDMEKRSREERNAPFVANFILNKDNIQKNEAWIKNMPAETLAKLLTVLINYHNIPNETVLWGLVGEKDEDRNAVAEHNAAQNMAILQIFEWLGANGIPSAMQLTRFENAVQRMGLNDPTQLDNGKKWERYAKNLLKIKQFFDDCLVNKYKSFYLSQQPLIKYDDFMAKSHNSFVNSIESLTRRAQLYQRESYDKYHGHQVGFPQYKVSLDNNSIKSQGYKEFNWVERVE